MHQLLFRVGVPLLAIAGIALAWDRFGWQGVAVVVTALVMWMLLHVNRMMAVLRRAADRPIGHVDSAVMLHARLKTGDALLHVLALTRALGALQSVKDQQPEIYRWSDGSGSHVDCEFDNGRLVRWRLVRPEQQDGATDMAPPSDAAAGRHGDGP